LNSAFSHDPNRLFDERGKSVIINRELIAPVGVVLLLMAIALYGISTIRVNDNPVKWFTPDHPVRVADEVLNRHFGGTYTAYLTL